METIYDRLRTARQAAGFHDAKDAAAALGVKYPTYVGHENGTNGIRLDMAILYARRYKVSLDWLCTGHGRGPKGERDTPYEIFLEACELPDNAQQTALEIIQALRKSQPPIAIGATR